MAPIEASARWTRPMSMSHEGPDPPPANGEAETEYYESLGPGKGI
jgi:hypothetical protein